MPKKPLALFLVLLAAAVAPPLALGRVNRHLADRYGSAVGQTLATLAADLPRPPPPEPLPLFSDADDAASFAAPPGKPQPNARTAKGKNGKAPKKRGVFVSAVVVLRLAEAKVMPRGVPVPANGPRPAGIRLVGVGALGIGMRDGDVLTRVLGGGVGSVGDVVGRVIAARDRRVREISGEFWRDGEAWSVVVEQPYLNPVASP